MEEMQELALEFIADLTGSRLLGGFRSTKGTIHTDGNYGLDMQLITSAPEHWNIQIQCNKYKGRKGKGSKSSIHLSAE